MPKVSNITVPHRHVQALRFLASAEEKTAQQIRDVLSGEERFSSVPALERSLTDVPGVSKRIAETLVGSILTLENLLISQKYDAVELSNAVAGADELELADSEKEVLAAQLSGMLSRPPIRELAKAAELAAESPNHYHSGRFLTDVRPIFSDDPKEPVQAAVVSQTLRLEYYDQYGDPSSLFVALNEADIVNLIEAANRALEKSRNLRAFLASANVRAIQDEEDER
ncbi:hypothetical protein [Streptomyces sp. NBC_00582]|uniref:hypothetical protein n=1 Tax=Streptomyces sp. NBC_00582 TaxID=2975783 RepID=UPI002E80CDC3|nr:hypothetical protein [Streptomyces sp. NBC_00582]WUB60919.1 DUF2780 domain-containing protein [Streptomyces sp. NBC_00582]